MKKNLISLFLALVLLTVGFTAVAEEITEPTRELGNFPERGILIGLTEEDVADGIACTFSVMGTEEISELPVFEINFLDPVASKALIEKAENLTEEELNDEDIFMELLYELFACNHGLYQIALFNTDYINEKKANNGMIAPELSVNDLDIIGENDGYTYVMLNVAEDFVTEDAELQARVDAAAVRARELVDTITYQTIVFAEGEFTEIPDAICTFETQDLAGNTVTDDLFYAKDLTVLNIWGTFCNPCIKEMPELAAWSAEMPENVQIIGLVADLNTAEDLETYEMAKAICEATGADAYTHLIAGEDFSELLSGVVGVPTTLFIDGNGAMVAEPVVGVSIARCQEIVNNYLGTL